MHLTMQEMLEIRDGAGGPDGSLHLAMCPACAAEVERLRRTTAELRALPEIRPPRDLWPNVRATWIQRRRRRNLAAAGGAILAVAASILLIVALPRGTGMPSGGSPVVATIPPDVADLVRESQELEERLRSRSYDSRVLDVGSASGVADLEDEIAVVDARLTRGEGTRPSAEEIRQLWKRRVNLMQRLVRAQDGDIAYVGL